MSIEFLDDSTLWVSLSFIIFVCITLKPMLAQLSESLEKKIKYALSNSFGFGGTNATLIFKKYENS